MFLTGRDSDDIICCIAALDAQHLSVPLYTQVAYSGGGFLPGVPDDRGMAAALVDDDVAFE